MHVVVDLFCYMLSGEFTEEANKFFKHVIPVAFNKLLVTCLNSISLTYACEILRRLPSLQKNSFKCFKNRIQLNSGHIPYSVKWWQGKTLANLANPEPFATSFTSKFLS